MRKIFFIAVVAVFVSGPRLHAAGETGFQFLSIGGGARANGMGEAHSALAEGADAIYWNPAGLGLASGNELTATYLDYIADAKQEYAGLALPVNHGRSGAFGLAATRFTIDNIETRDAVATRIGTTEQDDTALQVSYGRRIGGDPTGRRGWFAGAGVKQISERLAGLSANTIAWDAGLQYRPGTLAAQKAGEWTRRMSFGLSATQFGSGAKYDTQTTDLPTEIRAGAGYTHFIAGDALNLTADAVFPKNGSQHFNEGAEFWIHNVFALRIGFVGRQGAGSGLRAGAGFRFQKIELNYAWTGFGDALGNAHRLSLNWRFGRDAQNAVTGLKDDLVKFYLSDAQDNIASGAYHEAVISANRALEIDPGNPQALQLLTDAGEKMRRPDPLPAPQPEAGEKQESAQ
jgi:hypothetical protein